MRHRGRRGCGWICAVVVALWLGAGGKRAANAIRDPDAQSTVGFGELEEEWRGEVRHLSWRPRAFLYKGFLSDAECEHIKALARPTMEKSDVVNSDSGKFEDSHERTSTGTFLDPGQDAVVAAVEKRVAQIAMVPKENQEAIQVLRYVNGQRYEPHHDFFYDDLNKAPEVGGQRVMTVLMYLSTPEEGGETTFPAAEGATAGDTEGLSECGRNVPLAYKPVKGDALLFYSLLPDGTEDKASLHGSCPTLKGEKWSATIWMHVAAFRSRDEDGNVDVPPAPPKGPCDDDNEQCAEWAYFGECTKNPGYMLQACKASCNVCRHPPPAVHAPAPVKKD